MKRRLLNIITGVTLLAFMATSALWVRSYWRYDSVDWRMSDDRVDIWCLDGRIGFHWSPQYPYGPSGRWFTRDAGSISTVNRQRHRRGEKFGFNFAIYPTPGEGGTRPVYALVIPHGFVAASAATAAALAAYGLLRRRRRQFQAYGFCINCSYDLTGNVSGVCPESGSTTSPHPWK